MSVTPNLVSLPGGDGARREPPHSLDAEKFLLSACLLDGSQTLVAALQAGVTVTTFYASRHALIWQTMVELFRRPVPLALDTLMEEMRTRKTLEAVGGMTYLLEVTSAIPTTAQVPYFIQTIQTMAALRIAIRVGKETVEDAQNYHGQPLDEFFAKHLGDLSTAVRQARRGGGPPKLSDEIAAVKEDVTAAVEGRLDKSGWIYTGLPTFDERCLPMGSQKEDHLIVDAAGSGIGKSAFMRQVASHALERGQRVRIYTRETSTAGCIEQMASTRAAADLKHRETWPKDLLQRFIAECDKLDELADKRWWCVQHSAATPLQNIEDLENDARYFAAVQGAPHLWVVDYLQLFGAERRFHVREQEVAYIADRLQSLCRELGGVWLVGCQMNEKGLADMRTVRKNGDGKLQHRLPGPGDLRESQKIFHNSDRTIAHYLPPEDMRGQDQTSPNVNKPEVWLCQIKRRKGGNGVIKCWFEKRFTRFDEVSGNSSVNLTPVAPGMNKQQFKGGDAQ